MDFLILENNFLNFVYTMATTKLAQTLCLTMRLSTLVNDWHPQMPVNQYEWENFVNSDPIQWAIRDFEAYENFQTDVPIESIIVEAPSPFLNGNVYIRIVNTFLPHFDEKTYLKHVNDFFNSSFYLAPNSKIIQLAPVFKNL